MILALILAAYTNHAGNVVSGMPVKLDRTRVELAAPAVTNSYPLSIFPEGEQRRIAVDYATGSGDVSVLRIPADVRRTLKVFERSVARSEKRAQKKLCTEEESKALIEKTRDVRKAYLDKELKAGRITQSERSLLK